MMTWPLLPEVHIDLALFLLWLWFDLSSLGDGLDRAHGSFKCVENLVEAGRLFLLGCLVALFLELESQQIVSLDYLFQGVIELSGVDWFSRLRFLLLA